MAFLSRPFAKDERAVKAARARTKGLCDRRMAHPPRIIGADYDAGIGRTHCDATAIFKRLSSVNRGFVLNRCRRYNRARMRLFHRSAQKLQLDNIVGNKNISSLNAEPNGFCARLDSSRYFRNVVVLGDCVVLTGRGTARPLVMSLWVVLQGT